jgi:hypothetical protein
MNDCTRQESGAMPPAKKRPVKSTSGPGPARPRKAVPAEKSAAKAAAVPSDRLGRPKKPTTFNLTADLVERARNAIQWTRVLPGEASSLVELAEGALELAVTDLEQKYNDGKPFENIGALSPGANSETMRRVWALRRQVAGPDDTADE